MGGGNYLHVTFLSHPLHLKPCQGLPGTCFSKVLKLFGSILGDIVPFVSSKRRCLKAQNFALILIFTPFTTYETSFTELVGWSFTNGFLSRKVVWTFEKQVPAQLSKIITTYYETMRPFSLLTNYFLSCPPNQHLNTSSLLYLPIRHHKLLTLWSKNLN